MILLAVRNQKRPKSQTRSKNALAIEKRQKMNIGDIYEQMRQDFWSAHSSSLKKPLSQAQSDAYDQMLDEF